MTCSAGTYSNAAAGATACVSCEASKYANGAGLTACVSCPSGKIGIKSGMASETDACPTTCIPGTYANAITGATSCENCGAGTYSNATGSTSCQQCEAGKASTALAGTTCLDCLDSFANAPLGATECIGAPLPMQAVYLCGIDSAQHAAGYGPCVATPYHSLNVSGIPGTIELPALAGLSFPVVVHKLDRYNQIITIDSTSSLEAKAALNGDVDAVDASVTITGSFGVFQKGKAAFSIAVKPTFTNTDRLQGVVELLRQPYLFFEGLDSTTSWQMLSQATAVSVAENKAVCPVRSHLCDYVNCVLFYFVI